LVKKYLTKKNIQIVEHLTEVYFDQHPELLIPRLAARGSVDKVKSDIKVTSPLRRFTDYITLYQLTASKAGLEPLNATYINYVQSMYDSVRDRSIELNRWIKQKNAQATLIEMAQENGSVTVDVRFMSTMGKQVAGFKTLFDYNVIEVENNQLLTVRANQNFASSQAKMQHRVRLTLSYNKDSGMLHIEHIEKF